MGVHIALIGRPAIRDGAGEISRIRGEKAWAVLARIVLADRPIGRRRLAHELFPDADDPLGSLRWCLAELRRAVGSPESFRGDPVDPNLPEGTRVDTTAIEVGSIDGVDVAGELLEGLRPRGAPEFDTWLLVERERTRARCDAAVRRHLLGALSLRDWERAVTLGEIAVSCAPFDEGAHVLFVKALVGAGLSAAADRHVAATCARFRDELGVEPSGALRAAVRRAASEPVPGVSPRSVVSALVDAGRAALDAGATEAGIECLRRALGEADNASDPEIRAAVVLDLGIALVHSVRGQDDEGAVLLREAVDLGRDLDRPTVTATALSELGYTDALVGRRPTAVQYLDEACDVLDGALGSCGDAEGAPDGSHGVVAAIDAIRGFNLAEWGRFDEGAEGFERSIEAAHRAGDARREAWSLGLGARAHLLAGDIGRALDWSRRSLASAEREQWMAFRPWPRSVVAEVELLEGRRPDRVRDELEETFALSCQLGDPCWEGAAARGIALTHAAERRFDVALDWISDARRRCTRETDTFVGMTASILDTDASVADEAGDGIRAEAAARELLTLAARTHQDHFVRSSTTRLGIHSYADP